MENKCIEKQVKTINELIKNGKFQEAIGFTMEKGLDRKLPEIYFKMEKAGKNPPRYAAGDAERFGYLSAAIRYNRMWAKNNLKIQKNLDVLENWVLKSEQDIDEDIYFINSLLLEDAEQTGTSIDRNFHKKKPKFVKSSPLLQMFRLQNYKQN